jgi:hypothetical protein
MGDTRREKHVIPLGFKLVNVYHNAGFKLKELVIKRQHNCKTTGFWYENSLKYNFLLLAHEYLPIFEKPKTPTFVSERENGADYVLVEPILEEPLLKKRLDKLEITSVWIFPIKDFEERLNRNVIDRYSNGDDYSTITFVSHADKKINFTKRNEREKLRLLFIKSPFLNDITSYSNIEYYLEEIRNIVTQKLANIINNGFVVIQTQDIRIDGYIEPLAQKIVDKLKHDNLWLKEIVVVTQEDNISNSINSIEYLKIIHQYLLIYDVRK